MVRFKSSQVSKYFKKEEEPKVELQLVSRNTENCEEELKNDFQEIANNNHYTISNIVIACIKKVKNFLKRQLSD